MTRARVRAKASCPCPCLALARALALALALARALTLALVLTHNKIKENPPSLFSLFYNTYKQLNITALHRHRSSIIINKQLFLAKTTCNIKWSNLIYSKAMNNNSSRITTIIAGNNNNNLNSIYIHRQPCQIVVMKEEQ